MLANVLWLVDTSAMSEVNDITPENHFEGLLRGNIDIFKIWDEFPEKPLQENSEYMWYVVLPIIHSAIERLYRDRGEESVLKQKLEQIDASYTRRIEKRTALFDEYGFPDDGAAAEHIASYWQDEDKPQNLIECIRGMSSEARQETYKKAIGFAREAVEGNPEDEARLRDANNMLWRDYRGGQG